MQGTFTSIRHFSRFLAHTCLPCRDSPKGFVTKSIAILETGFLDLIAKDEGGNGCYRSLREAKVQDFHSLKHEGKNLQDMFRVVVQKGLNPWGKDCEQMTPLDIAAVCGNERILEKFRKYG